MKSKEELLSEEARAAGDISLRTIQWGVTLMVSLLTALFFVRQQVLQRSIDAHELSIGSEVPATRYYMGTVFLFGMALILAKLTARTLEQYRNYKTQLMACRTKDNGVKDLPIKYTGRWAYILYFVFPIVDVLARVYIVSIQIHL